MSRFNQDPYLFPKPLARFCCELPNLQHLAKSVVFESVPPNKAPNRSVGNIERLRNYRLEPVVGQPKAAMSVMMALFSDAPQ
ncbi:MAG: hypothetical protein ABSH24_33425 [Bryobacteraceae bacterium]